MGGGVRRDADWSIRGNGNRSISVPHVRSGLGMLGHRQTGTAVLTEQAILRKETAALGTSHSYHSFIIAVPQKLQNALSGIGR